jgi:signal transduction histidine kinase
VTALRDSVAAKLMGVVLLSTLAALAVAVGAMLVYDLSSYHRNWVADLTTQADLLARTSAPALAFDDARAARENVELLRSRPRVRAAAIYNARGKLFASYAAAGEHAFPDLPEADGARVEGDDLVVFRRIIEGKEILGTVYLRADYQLYGRLFGYLGISALVVAVAMLVAYALSMWMQRAVMRPLIAISEVARQVTGQRNYALRAQKLSSDEVGMLAEAFNAMLTDIGQATRELQAAKQGAEREAAERRRIEEEVKRLNTELELRVRERTAQLEYTNGELEAFCYTVSHDLRAPLRAIDGFSQALLEDFPRDVPEEAQRYLGRIRSATQRMGQLIEDLLNLSRVSRIELARREIDVGEIARQVATDLHVRNPARAVEIVVWDDLPASADPRLLRAALENLMGNAWKFTGKTERPRVEVGALRENGRSTFFVKDNGAGFDMAYASKLFGAFQRLHSEREYAGTGIGLATVQRIVHRHGGRIWAEAKPGKGAVFFFTLEAGEAASMPPQAAKAHA